MSTELSRQPQAHAPQPYRFTVDDVSRMAEAGVLAPDARLELIDGQLLRMSPTGPHHAHAVTLLDRLLQERVGDAFLVRCQQPLLVDLHTQPEPDLAVVPAGDYSRAHPSASQAQLVVEVSRTSLKFDLEVKASVYAAAGVRCVWVVDVAGRTVTVHEGPTADGYASLRQAGPGGELVLPGGSTLAVDAFLVSAPGQ